MLAMVQEISSRTFDSAVQQSQMPVLVEVYASWCPRCAMMADTVETFAEENAGRIRVCRIEEKEACSWLNVMEWIVFLHFWLFVREK